MKARIDMSSEAIDKRIREVAQLYRLGLLLKEAKRLGKARDFLEKKRGEGKREE